jgi:NADH-quinone oxidoreductase subunit L
MEHSYLLIPVLPVIGALLSGFLGKYFGKAFTLCLVLSAIVATLGLSFHWLNEVNGGKIINHDVYTWAVFGDALFSVGFLIDPLSSMMTIVVCSISLMVHIYTIKYMEHDEGFFRFLSYISLFTGVMLSLVLSNNFLQLFFGWEGVGLVSYLLIGFWYTKESAIYANMKAFIVNRVGDLGFLLGIGLLFKYTNTLHFDVIFQKLSGLTAIQYTLPLIGSVSVISLIALLLFIGAMSKSAQIPLHAWLPDSMEGPTPISALIHAATMVTAGIFMVSRFSPLFEHSDAVLNFMLGIGALTAASMGILAIVQHDIKRIVAYSTLSQLGYMTAALGASAYRAAVFHLFTHAFFKAMLFLGAGAVILAKHHEQDIRRMGGLAKKMPVTYVCMFLASLALSGIAPFSGFFSKEPIIEAVKLSSQPIASAAYVLLMIGVVLTPFYSFNLLFRVFHGKENHGHDDHHHHEHHADGHPEPFWTIRFPFIVLAIFSVINGFWLAPNLLYGTFFGGTLSANAAHSAWFHITKEFEGIPALIGHSVTALPTWLAILGIVASWIYVRKVPVLAEDRSPEHTPLLLSWLKAGYGFDCGYKIIAQSVFCLGGILSCFDKWCVDGVVNVMPRIVNSYGQRLRQWADGSIATYAFFMVIGVVLMLGYMLFFSH